MIPRDIETTDQWQVRWEGHTGEIVRTGTEKQVRYMAAANEAYGAIVEVRTITVGAWRNPDAPEQSFEEDHEAD